MNFAVSVSALNRDIAGIDIFMHDASTLHGLQPPCQLYGDMQKGSQFKPVLRNQVRQGDGIEVFCNKKRTVRGVLKGMVEDDMGVCEGAPSANSCRSRAICSAIGKSVIGS